MRAETTHRVAVTRLLRSDDEVKVAFAEREGSVERAAQAVEYRLPRVYEPRLVVEVVDGNEPAHSVRACHDPVVAPGPYGGVLGRPDLDAPPVNQHGEQRVQLQFSG